MIVSFADKETEALFNREKVKRIPANIQERALHKLLILHAVYREDDLKLPPGNRYEKLKGKQKGISSIRINDQWRICFRWKDGNAHEVAIEDYH